MSLRTLILILEVLAGGGVGLLIYIAGHRMGCWSCRHDYANGFDKGWAGGEETERAAWEEATGTTLDQFTAWHRPPEPGLDGGWQEPPATEVLRAEYSRQGYTEPVPSVAELDQMVAEYDAKAGADSHVRTGASTPGWLGADARRSHPSPAYAWQPPIVADLTGPAAWHYPEDDVPTLTGLVVTPPRRDRTGPDWLEYQLAAQDSETEAYLRRVRAEMASFRRGITSGVSTGA